MFCLGQYQQHIFMSMAHFLLEIKGFSKTYFMASECFLTLFQTTLCFQMSVVQVFGKHWEKERLLVFSTLLENFPSFSSNLELSYSKSFSLGESKICPFGKG